MWELIWSKMKKLEKAVSNGGSSGCHITKIEINETGPLTTTFENASDDPVEIPAEYAELLDKAISDGTPVLWKENPLDNFSATVLFTPNLAVGGSSNVFSALSYNLYSGVPLFIAIISDDGDVGSRQYFMAAIPLTIAST